MMRCNDFIAQGLHAIAIESALSASDPRTRRRRHPTYPPCFHEETTLAGRRGRRRCSAPCPCRLRAERRHRQRQAGAQGAHGRAGASSSPQPAARSRPKCRASCKDEVDRARGLHAGSAEAAAWTPPTTTRTQMELARQAILIRQLFENYRKTNPVTDADVQGRVRQVRRGQRRQGIQGAPHPGREGRRGQEDHRRPQEGRASSRTSPRSRARTRARAPTAATSTGPAPAASCPSSPRRMIKLKKGEMTHAPVKSQFG